MFLCSEQYAFKKETIYIYTHCSALLYRPCKDNSWIIYTYIKDQQLSPFEGTLEDGVPLILRWNMLVPWRVYKFIIYH